jgi:hypothetical protein
VIDELIDLAKRLERDAAILNSRCAFVTDEHQRAALHATSLKLMDTCTEIRRIIR